MGGVRGATVWLDGDLTRTPRPPEAATEEIARALAGDHDRNGHRGTAAGTGTARRSGGARGCAATSACGRGGRPDRRGGRLTRRHGGTRSHASDQRLRPRRRQHADGRRAAGAPADLRAQLREQHRGCDQPGHAAGDPAVRGWPGAPARGAVVGSQAAVRDQRSEQHADADQPGDGPPRPADPGRGSVQPLLHARRQPGDRGRRAARPARLPKPAHVPADPLAACAVCGGRSHRLLGQRPLPARHLRVLRADPEGRRQARTRDRHAAAAGRRRQGCRRTSSWRRTGSCSTSPT